MPTVLEPVGRAFKKARAAMTRPDDTGKLEAALAELHKLVESQRAERDQSKKAIAALSQYGQESQAAAGAFNHAVKTGTIEEIQAAFEAWVQVKACAEQAQQIMIGLQHDSYHDAGAQWVAANPDAKDVLLRVCELRLQVARDRAASIKADEQSRLDSLGEFSADDSPVYKREADKVAALEAILNRINTQEIQDVFANTASTLLEWDE
jgi:hypothetical protein